MKYFFLISLGVACVCSLPQQQQKPVVSKGGRILGGLEAQPGQFPWQAAVYFDTNSGTGFCSGALIHRRWILTAAQCVWRANIFTIRLGATALSDSDPHKLVLTTVYSIAHPNFNPDTLENDVGLIQLQTDVKTNKYIQTIPLAKRALGAGVSVTVSGWGGIYGALFNLSYVTLTTESLAQCKDTFEYAALPNSLLCAGGHPNQEVCREDIGGPLVAINANGRTVHAGIVSGTVGTNGCKTTQDSVYVRTSYYASWINSVIG